MAEPSCNTKMEKKKVSETSSHTMKSHYVSGMPFSQPSSFFTSKVLEEQGILDETLHYGMDYDFFVRNCSELQYTVYTKCSCLITCFIAIVKPVATA